MWRNPAHLAYIILSPILSTIFALLNILAIYVFYKKFRLATMSLIVIVNICACDIFVCFLSNPFYVVNLLHPTYTWTTGSTSCKLFKFLTMTTNVAQIYLLCFLNADRLSRLVECSKTQWQKKHGLVCAGFSWFFAILVCLPRLLQFGIKEIKKPIPDLNTTVVVNYLCKPVGLEPLPNMVITVTTFLLAYAIPASYIMFTLARAQAFMWERRKRIHLCTTKNAVLKLSSKLALTFNLTAALFMFVWTPFFVLSLVDLRRKPITMTATYTITNFSLRCTLLILGSAKPLIYMICLDKFRNSLRCGLSDKMDASEQSTLSTTRSKETHLTVSSYFEAHPVGNTEA